MTVTFVGTDAENNGTRFLYDLFTMLADSGEITADSSTHAAAKTDIAETGYDGDVTMGGSDFGENTGTITSMTWQYGNLTDMAIYGASISFADLKEATTDLKAGDDTAIAALFKGMDWTIDVSQVSPDTERGVVLFGTGGSDQFTFSDNAESLMLDGGDDAIDLKGGDDSIYASNIYHYAGKGMTTIEGGTGTDTFYLNFNGLFDREMFAKGQTVNLDGKMTFGVYSVKLSHVENAVGSKYADTLIGSDFDSNALSGMAGNDHIQGGGKSDTLTGGSGKDDFIYTKLADSRAGPQHDLISDFKHKADDIDLSAINPKTADHKFVFIDGQKFHHDVGEVRFVRHHGEDAAHDFTLVQIDINGDAKADMELEMAGIVNLSKGDFLL